jgi:predicted nucleic-acid-binding protein
MDRLKLTTKELKQQALDRLTNRAKLIPDVNIIECVDYLNTTYNKGRLKMRNKWKMN